MRYVGSLALMVLPSDASRARLARNLARAVIGLTWLALGAGLVWLAPQVFDGWTLWREQMLQAPIVSGVPEDSVNGPDPTLGWKHVPGRSARMAHLGDDVVWTINGNGFRGDRDYTTDTPPGMHRVIGVGDSFTFGQVAASDTWPVQLEQRLVDTEVINMGASGYGVDQMFLWYQQDGVRFETDIVVLAVIGDDMRRVSLERWPSGYAKPRFRTVDDRLVLTNVPVPPRLPAGKPLVGWSGMLTFIATRIVRGDPTATDRVTPLRIVRAFADEVHARGDRFLLVYLAQPWGRGEDWSTELAELSTRADIPYLDVRAALLAAQGGGAEIDERWFGPNTHYNRAANEVVATEIAGEITRRGWISQRAIAADGPPPIVPGASVGADESLPAEANPSPR